MNSIKHSSYIMTSVEKTLKLAANNIISGIYNPHSLLCSLDVCTSLCRGFDDILSTRLMCIFERVKSLYFHILSARKLVLQNGTMPLYAYFQNCCENSVNILSLFQNLSDNIPQYTENKHLYLSENESLLESSKNLRLSALARHGKIYSALPELEGIYACTKILSKAQRLIPPFDVIYNKFTLCT